MRNQRPMLFVVPFFLDGDIDQIRIYSDVAKAQAALRRYVGYSRLLKVVRSANPTATRQRAMLDAYGAISGTPFAGTAVYEVEVDERRPVRPPPKGTRYGRS